ncbi:hypothetical protein [Heyndrickxia sporothermodurans]|jgi:hypothetical protein|uniref:hypothetical protein n=1 Tax=Heyndrickxia sporothermodurans TaxID=46224 RepID=UPI000D3DAA93|nr:hypothetical protein [Heyndrickxia sporothermodurans]PTY92867.1 hypothetical protein B5V90_01970 [Heyndrickxia sporothermodurans]
MSIIRFVDRDIHEPIDYEVAPIDAVLKYVLKKNLPESLPKDTFIYTIDTQELYHGAGYGLPLKKVYTEEETRKTAVFYFGMLDDANQKVTLYVPLKGVLTRMYVNLGQESAEDLTATVYNAAGEEVASVIVESGERFATLDILGTVNYETLKVVVNGELSLPDINVLVDIIPIRND